MKFNLKNTSFNAGRKQMTFNLIVNIIAYAVSIGISFILTPFLINSVGKEAYSFYPVSTSITNTMITITSALNTVASRFIVVSIFRGEKENADKYFSSAFFADGILSFVLLVLMTIFVLFIDKFLNVPINVLASVRMLFTFTFASALVNIMSAVFGAATFAKNRTDLRSFGELGSSILRLLLFLLFYSIFPANVLYIGLIAFFVSVVNLIVQLFYTKMLLPGMKISRKDISKTHTKEIFSSTIWVAINSIGMMLLSSTTIIIANITYGPSISGVLSIAHTIPGFMGGIVSLLCGVYYPLITNLVAKHDKQGLERLLQKIQTIIGVLVFAIIIVFSLFSNLFFGLWVPEENPSYLSTLSFIYLFPYFFTSCFWIYTFVFTALNNVKIPAIASVVFGTAAVGLQFLFGKIGLDVTTLPITCTIIQCLSHGIFFPYYLNKATGIKYKSMYLVPAKIAVISILVTGLAFVIQTNVRTSSWVSFVVFGGSTGILSLIVFYSILIPKQIKNELTRLLSKIKRGKKAD